MIKVSVIIPVYNGEDYIQPCLESILNQTLQEIEIIVINDASCDSTKNILEQYKRKNEEKIKIIENDENQGQGKARNIGIELAKGEYVTFIDADDEIEKDMLQKMYNKAKEENADLIVCDYYEMTQNNKIVKKSIDLSNEEIEKSYIVSVASPWGKLIRKEVLTKNNLKFIETGAYEDISIVPAIGIYANKILYIEEPLYVYYIRSNSTMRQNEFNNKLFAIYEVLEYLTNIFKQAGRLEEFKEEIEFIYIKHLLYAGIGRFLEYKEGKKQVGKVTGIIKNKYPNWRSNKYYKRQDKLFKLNCNIFYSNCLFIIVPFRKVINKIKREVIVKHNGKIQRKNKCTKYYNCIFNTSTNYRYYNRNKC